jgi:hypothetical protein
MCKSSAHPREGGDPVLSSLTPARRDNRMSQSCLIHHPKYWVPAFAGMSGCET